MRRGLPWLCLLGGCVLTPDTPSPGATRPDTGTRPTTVPSTGATAPTGDSATAPTATTADTGPPAPLVIAEQPSLRVRQAGDLGLAGIGGMVAVLDFLDDPGNELVTGNTTGPTYVWSVAGQRGSPVPADLLQFTLEGGHLGVLSRDLDGDGRRDLLQHDGFLDGLWTVHPSPYDPATAFTLYDIRGHANATCVADLDGDTHLDLMLRRDFGGDADVFFGPFFPGEHRPEAELRELTFDQRHGTTHLLCPGDLTGDGVPDLLNVGGSVAFYDATLTRDTTLLTGARLLPFKHANETPHVIDHPTRPGDRALWVAADFPYTYRLLDLPLVDPGQPDIIATLERASDATLRFGDVDGDGSTDAVMKRWTSGPYRVLVFFGPLTGLRTLDDWDLQIETGSTSIPIHHVDDIDLDGVDDLILTGEWGDRDHDEIQVYFGPLPRPGEVWTP